MLPFENTEKYIAVNCGAIPKEQLTVNYSWTRKGSFTGATSTQVVILEVADGGTIF
jgi:DNA-binding NtrC family response regulator